MSKHTPGPWVATFNRNTTVEGVDLTFDVDGDRGCIARGQSAEHLKIDGQNDDPIMAAECEANARLIAAAPELLAACQLAMMLKRVGGMLPGVKEIVDEVVKEAEAAIKKATT